MVEVVCSKRDFIKGLISSIAGVAIAEPLMNSLITEVEAKAAIEKIAITEFGWVDPKTNTISFSEIVTETLRARRKDILGNVLSKNALLERLTNIDNNLKDNKLEITNKLIDRLAIKSAKRIHKYDTLR